MTERIEERLGSTLTRQAEWVVEAPRFSVDDIVRAGRTAEARRRAAGISGAVACVAVLLIVVGVVAAAKRRDEVQPAGPMLVGAVGLDIWYGGIVQRADGRRLTLALPPRTTVREVVGVPGGWVVTAAAENEERALWFAPYEGEPRWISAAYGDHQVSPDGRVLVVAGLAEDGTGIGAYELPSLNRLAATDYGVDAGVSVAVVGVGGDRALLAGAQGSPPWQETAIWNVRTGGLHRTGGHDWALAFGRDGQVLRRADRPASGAACVDLVTLADTPPEPGPPVCAPALATAEAGGMLSPGGRWVMLRTASPAGGGLGTVLLRTADLRAGHWRPVTPDLPPSGVPRFWDTDDTFVVEKPGNPSEAYRCTTRGCAPLILPADLPRAEIVVKFG